jgi:hypothetical protein
VRVNTVRLHTRVARRHAAVPVSTRTRVYPLTNPCNVCMRLLSTQPGGVKLAQQYWVRTDYSEPPYNDHPGMHLDHACLPWQREATPQQHYYLCQVALSDIPPGGAATMVSPAAFRRAKAAAAQLQREQPGWCAALQDEEFRTTLTGRCGQQPEPGEIVEVTQEEGDVAIMDPMMMHAATPMRHPGRSRYVAYSSFFDASASGPVLLPTRGATEPSAKYDPQHRQPITYPPSSSELSAVVAEIVLSARGWWRRWRRATTGTLRNSGAGSRRVAWRVSWTGRYPRRRTRSRGACAPWLASKL